MSDIHARTSAAFLADAKARCDAAASIPADAAAADQAIAAIEAGLIDGGMSARDRAATILSIETLRAKADRAGMVDAARLRASAARLEADLAEAPAMMPQQAQQQQGQAVSVYIETRTLGGDVIRRHGPFARDSGPYRDAWHAEHCACEGHNRSRRHDDRSAQRVFTVGAP